MTLVEIVREYFPDADDAEIDHLIWGETGYPAFWDIPTTGATPQDVFLIQIARAAARENFGEFGYFDNEKSMDLAFEEMRNAMHEEEPDEPTEPDTLANLGMREADFR